MTLPEDLCGRLEIGEGSRVEFFLTSDGQVHLHAITQGASGFGGFNLDRRRPPVSIREMDDAIAEHVCEKYDRLNSRRDGDRVDETTRSAAQ